tara:strand:+ start:501 stop:692 length:192 start_codon:yes stop_codon:yes gene_type:complete
MFKFKLGDIVIPIPQAQQQQLPHKPSKVVAIQLRGWIRVQPLDEPQKLLVKADDYELWHQEKN